MRPSSSSTTLVNVIEVDYDLARLIIELASDLFVIVVDRCLVSDTLRLDYLSLLQACCLRVVLLLLRGLVTWIMLILLRYGLALT